MTPEMPAGTPWWGYLIAIVILTAVPGVVSIVVSLISRRDTKRELQVTRDEVAIVRDGQNEALAQLKNTHKTNLREDIDDLVAIVRDGQAAIRDDIGGLHSETRDLRQDVEGIRTDARRDRRRLTAQEKALDEHLAEVPQLIEQAIAKHVWPPPPGQ